MARENNKAPRRAEENDGLIKKTISINRVTKVVKGGRNMRFAAFVPGSKAGRCLLSGAYPSAASTITSGKYTA